MLHRQTGRQPMRHELTSPCRVTPHSATGRRSRKPARDAGHDVAMVDHEALAEPGGAGRAVYPAGP